MPGALVTVKLTPLLETLDDVTTTFPVEAAVGTGTRMPDALHCVAAPVTPANVTLHVVPKFAPRTVTGVVIGPFVGQSATM